MPRPLCDVLEEVGAFGRYQVVQLILSFVCVLVGAANTFSFIFSNAVPTMTCPSAANDSAWRQAARAAANGSGYCAVSAAQRALCPDWLFQSPMEETSATRFSATCRPLSLTLSETGFMLGFLIGSVAYGYVSDRCGRLRALTAASVHLLLATLLSALAPDDGLFGLSRFLAGMGAAGVVSVATAFMTESVQPRHRGYVGLLLNLAWPLALLLVSLLAVALRRSSKMELTLAMLCLLPLLTSVTLRESPRWLLTRGRAEEAVTILRLVAAFNGRRAPALLPASLEGPIVACPERLTLLSILRSHGMRSVALLLWLVFFVVSFVYYGVTVTFQSLASGAGWNLFAVVGAGAAIELGGLVAVVKVVECTPRRWLLLSGLTVVSLLCFVAGAVADSDDHALSVLCLLARPAVAAVFSAVVLYAVEVFPTSHRTMGLGLCNAVARISAIAAPFFHFMGGVWPGLPFLVYGIAAAGAGALFLLLPETRGKASPETMEEAEKLADDHGFRTCWRYRSPRDHANRTV